MTTKVITRPYLTLGHHESLDICVARFEELGLTAYGKTGDEAYENLRSLYSRFIKLALVNDTLKAQLDHSGVEWSIQELDESVAPEKEQALSEYLRQLLEGLGEGDVASEPTREKVEMVS